MNSRIAFCPSGPAPFIISAHTTLGSFGVSGALSAAIAAAARASDPHDSHTKSDHHVLHSQYLRRMWDAGTRVGTMARALDERQANPELRLSCGRRRRSYAEGGERGADGPNGRDGRGSGGDGVTAVPSPSTAATGAVTGKATKLNCCDGPEEAWG
jgi:hypothetical protein